MRETTLEAQALGDKALEWAESAGARNESVELLSKELKPDVAASLCKRAKRDMELARQYLDQALTSARTEGARQALEDAAKEVRSDSIQLLGLSERHRLEVSEWLIERAQTEGRTQP